jgi:hypothetical protein
MTKRCYHYICPNCGEYTISDFLFKTGIDAGFKRHLLSGYIREMNELGKTDILLTTQTDHDYRDYLNSPIIPQTIGDRIDKLLLYLYRKTERLHQTIPIDLNSETAICYAFDVDELHEIVKLLRNSGYINQLENMPDTSLSLTFKGIQHAERLAGVRANG